MTICGNLRAGLAGFSLALAPVAIIGAGKETDVAVASAIRKQGRAEANLAAGHDVARDNSGDFVSLFFKGENVRVHEQADVLFCPYHAEFLCIIVGGGGLGKAASSGIEFGDHNAKRRIGRKVDVADRADANFGTAVAAEDGTILNERDLQAQPCRGDGTRGARYPAADDDKIEWPCIFGHRAKAKGLLAKCGKNRAFVRWTEVGVGSKENCIATAIEAGQVMERKRNLACRQVDRSTVLPMPRFAFRAELWSRESSRSQSG